MRRPFFPRPPLPFVFPEAATDPVLMKSKVKKEAFHGERLIILGDITQRPPHKMPLQSNIQTNLQESVQKPPIAKPNNGTCPLESPSSDCQP